MDDVDVVLMQLDDYDLDENPDNRAQPLGLDEDPDMDGPLDLDAALRQLADYDRAEDPERDGPLDLLDEEELELVLRAALARGLDYEVATLFWWRSGDFEVDPEWVWPIVDRRMLSSLRVFPVDFDAAEVWNVLAARNDWEMLKVLVHRLEQGKRSGRYARRELSAPVTMKEARQLLLAKAEDGAAYVALVRAIMTRNNLVTKLLLENLRHGNRVLKMFSHFLLTGSPDLLRWVLHNLPLERNKAELISEARARGSDEHLKLLLPEPGQVPVSGYFLQSYLEAAGPPLDPDEADAQIHGYLEGSYGKDTEAYIRALAAYAIDKSLARLL